MKNEFDDVTHNETLTAFTNMVYVCQVFDSVHRIDIRTHQTSNCLNFNIRPIHLIGTKYSSSLTQAVAYVIPPDSHYRII